MAKIIVTTDFSDSSLNALNYACALAKENGFQILLLNIYTIPVTYTGDGVSLATVNDAMQEALDKVNDLVTDAHNNFPGVVIVGKTISGGYLESLEQQIAETKPETIIMGAAGEYSDLWLWDEDWLSALTTLPVPVLVIPPHIKYKPIKNVAFACDYKNACVPQQIHAIKQLVSATGATLNIVHVNKDQEPVSDKQNAQFVRQAFSSINPVYHEIEGPHIIKAIAAFTVAHQIDLLVVVPHRHGLWYKLFHKSYTKQLASLNQIPVMALHES